LIFQLEGKERASQPAVDRKVKRKPFEHLSFTTSNLSRFCRGLNYGDIEGTGMDR